MAPDATKKKQAAYRYTVDAFPIVSLFRQRALRERLRRGGTVAESPAIHVIAMCVRPENTPAFGRRKNEPVSSKRMSETRRIAEVRTGAYSLLLSYILS